MWRVENNKLFNKTHLGEELKYEQEEPIKFTDFDAVSLYPSAIYRMPGLLKGEPKILLPEQRKYGFFKNNRWLYCVY